MPGTTVTLAESKRKHASVASVSVFRGNRDPVQQYVRAMMKYSGVTSKEALALVDKLDAKQLATPCELITKMSFTQCKVKSNVRHSVGTQCLIYMFDPGNGWARCSTLRGDMLVMMAKLLEKGVSIDGLSYYDQTFEQSIQIVIESRQDDRPAKINDYVINVFREKGYKFRYPQPCAAKADQIQATISGPNCVIP